MSPGGGDGSGLGRRHDGQVSSSPHLEDRDDGCGFTVGGDRVLLARLQLGEGRDPFVVRLRRAGLGAWCCAGAERRVCRRS